MSELSFYQVSVPVFVRGLEVIASELAIASASATTRGFSPDVLVSARLSPDMLPLSGQVQRASDTSKFSAERLSGVASPRFEDKEQTVPELIARVQGTIDYLRTIEPSHFEQMVKACHGAARYVQPRGLLIAIRAAEFLFSCEHHPRHLAPQRRGAR